MRLLCILLCFAPLRAPAGQAADDWRPFEPAPDPFTYSPMDLRGLNETVAGQHGFIAARGGQFVHSDTGKPTRFWGVNGPPADAQDRHSIRQVARTLAKRGVNLVRIHTPVFDGMGEPDLKKVKRIQTTVEEMKAEGIYTLLSIYFPLWLRPAPDTKWLQGYDGRQHPFAALFFNPDFQEHYRRWWRELLLTPSESTGNTLIEEPAVAALEILNEDSLFFWTFSTERIPEPQLRLLETRFARWLEQKHGSLAETFRAWDELKLERDAPAQGRIAFRPLWNIFNDKTIRDRETVEFLFATQTGFYSATIEFLRLLGFKGVITTSNWTTASPEVLGPLEKLSYTVGDFVDRHGYFSCQHRGEHSAWSIREGHTYSDRSALRFDPEEWGKPRLFAHPAMDVHYEGKPSMISETTWNRPNRFRSEAPLYYAAYGALQDSDAIVHFALDGERWTVKPGFFVQPWTLMSPAMIGQFPAAALIFRQSLIAAGPVVASLQLNTNDLFQLKGTPLAQDAALDELRMPEVPRGIVRATAQRINPLIHYVGQSLVRFTGQPTSLEVADLRACIDQDRQCVTSATDELILDYRTGLLTLNAPKAQGLSGNLKAAGRVQLRNIELQSDLELGHIVVVPLDGQRLDSSDRMLIQVMSEEQPTAWETVPDSPGVERVVNLGHDPWRVRRLQGWLRFKSQDRERWKVTALDPNGYPIGGERSGATIELLPDVTFYLAVRNPGP